LLFHDAHEGQPMEVKGVGRKGTQFLDDLGSSKGYWELKEHVEDRRR
jgi:hypothetical protein